MMHVKHLLVFRISHRNNVKWFRNHSNIILCTKTNQFLVNSFTTHLNFQTTFWTEMEECHCSLYPGLWILPLSCYCHTNYPTDHAELWRPTQLTALFVRHKYFYRACAKQLVFSKDHLMSTYKSAMLCSWKISKLTL